MHEDFVGRKLQQEREAFQPLTHERRYGDSALGMKQVRQVRGLREARVKRLYVTRNCAVLRRDDELRVEPPRLPMVIGHGQSLSRSTSAPYK